DSWDSSTFADLVASPPVRRYHDAHTGFSGTMRVPRTETPRQWLGEMGVVGPEVSGVGTAVLGSLDPCPWALEEPRRVPPRRPDSMRATMALGPLTSPPRGRDRHPGELELIGGDRRMVGEPTAKAAEEVITTTVDACESSTGRETDRSARPAGYAPRELAGR